MLNCSYGENPGVAGLAITNAAKSGSGQIWKKQIRYSPSID